MHNQQRLPAVLGAAALAAAGFGLWHLTKVVFMLLTSSYDEAQRALVFVTARIASDSPDHDAPPEELVQVDEEPDGRAVYVYEGGMQDLYLRRSAEPWARSDWEFSYSMVEWHETCALAREDHSMHLDPPTLIFLLRMELISTARRKAAAAAADAAAAAAHGSGSTSGRRAASRIPPPVPLPGWAARQMQATTAAAAAGGGGWQQQQQQEGSGPGAAAGEQERHLLDAPDALCCPITGQIMLQPVVLPSGRSCEYAAVRSWITAHGSDPTTLEPLSLRSLHPNLVVRELVERWLQGDLVLREGGESSSSGSSSGGAAKEGAKESAAGAPAAAAAAAAPSLGPQQKQQEHHHQHHQQHQQPQLSRLQQQPGGDSDDSLSSFGASGSSSDDDEGGGSSPVQQLGVGESVQPSGR